MKLSAYIKQLESLLETTGDVEVVSYTGGYLHNAPNPRIPKHETVVAVG